MLRTLPIASLCPRPQPDVALAVALLMRLRVPYILVVAVLALALPAGAHAALFEYDGSFGSGVKPDGGLPGPSGIAVDEAGRVFVADSGGGRVEVFDNAENGNKFL